MFAPDVHGIFQIKTNSQQNDGWRDIVVTDYDYRRDYLLFAWLGWYNKNSNHFIKPVVCTRGIPNSFGMNSDHRHYLQPHNTNQKDLSIWMGTLMFSWVSFREVMDAPSQMIEYSGVITIDEFNKWDGVSIPECGDIVRESEWVISAPIEITDKTTHVRVNWKEDVLDSIKYFIDEFQRLADIHGPDIRFVFGFDA